MKEKQRSLVPMAFLVLLYLDNVNGLASNIMNSKKKLSSYSHCHYPLTSSPLSYAIDSTRMGTDVHAMPQNMSLPLILSDEDILPSMQSSVTADTATTRKGILANTWQKIKGAMKFDRQAIAKMGIDFGLTYNMVSNINGSVTLSAAWYIACMKVRNIGSTTKILIFQQRRGVCSHLGTLLEKTHLNIWCLLPPPHNIDFRRVSHRWLPDNGEAF